MPRSKKTSRSSVASRQRAASGPRTNGQPAELSNREKQVVRLISLGCTLNEAALILHLSPSTIDNHKTRIMAKLSTNKITLLTRIALKRRYTTLDDCLSAAEKRTSGRKRDGWN
jgi:DNA-binding CsgD family transcriptional regulator